MPERNLRWAVVRARQAWQDTRTSFWFVPASMVVSAVVLALAMIYLDARFRIRDLNGFSLLLGAGAEGSRGLLEGVAGAMITVAGVVFSITIVALSLASSQYSSRVIRNFMRDRVNQTVLGVFLGIYAYCLVVLRTIQTGEEGGFVPAVAVLVGLLLAFVGIAFLIYFIHHIANSIQAAHILAAAASETLSAVDRLFPEAEGEPLDDDDQDEPYRTGQEWYPIHASHNGYLQAVDTDVLLALAAELHTVIRMEHPVGEFVIQRTPVCWLLLAEPPSDSMQTEVSSAFEVGRQRTVYQDAAFGIRQIEDVALKSLSPGINDTTTAVMCVNYLTAILTRLSRRRIASHFRGTDGEMRLVTSGPSYADLVDQSLSQVRRNAEGNVTVLGRLLESLERLAYETEDQRRRQVLLAHAHFIREVSRRTVSGPDDLQALEKLGIRVCDLLSGKQDK